MNSLLAQRLLVALSFFLLATSANAQIRISGDYSPAYDGTNPWDVGELLSIGIDGPGMMTIDFADVFSDGGVIGENAKGIGRVFISSFSQWDAGDGTIVVGRNGTGRLDVLGGYVVAKNVVAASEGSGSQGTINIEGSSSVLNITGLSNEFPAPFIVGNGGDAELTMSDFATLFCNGTVLGNSSQTITNVTLDDALWTINGNLQFSTGLGGGDVEMVLSNSGIYARDGIDMCGKETNYSVTVQFGSLLWAPGGVSICEYCSASLFIDPTSELDTDKGNIEIGGFDEFGSTSHSISVAGTATTGEIFVWDNGSLTVSGFLSTPRIVVAGEFASTGCIDLLGGDLSITLPSDESGVYSLGGQVNDVASIHLDLDGYPGGTLEQNGEIEVGVSNRVTKIHANYEVNGSIALDLLDTDDGESIQVFGNVDLVGSDQVSNANLDLTLHYAPEVGDSFVVVDNFLTTDSTTGQFMQGSVVNATYDGFEYGFQIDYTGGDGNDIVITALSNEVTPIELNVVQGILSSGSVIDLAQSDDADVGIWRANTDLTGSVILEVNSISPVTDPAFFEFKLESSVFARSKVTQSIELYDHESTSWKQVDSRSAMRFSDSVVAVQPLGSATRFVGPENQIAARIIYQTVAARRNFLVNVDQIIWNISP